MSAPVVRRKIHALGYSFLDDGSGRTREQAPDAAIVHVRAIPQIKPKGPMDEGGQWADARTSQGCPPSAHRPKKGREAGQGHDPRGRLLAEDSRTPGHRPRQPRPPEAEGPWPEREPCTIFTYSARFPLGKVLAHRGTASDAR